jgi:hypothetical protein
MFDLEKLALTIKKRSRIEGEHVIWFGAKTEAGYGKIVVKNGTGWRSINPARIVLAIAGKLNLDDKSILACHECDRRDCIKEEHLYAGTHEDNRSDEGYSYRTGSLQIGGVCPNGHKLESTNDVYITKRGTIAYCRACNNSYPRNRT